MGIEERRKQRAAAASQRATQGQQAPEAEGKTPVMTSDSDGEIRELRAEVEELRTEVETLQATVYRVLAVLQHRDQEEQALMVAQAQDDQIENAEEETDDVVAQQDEPGELDNEVIPRAAEPKPLVYHHRQEGGNPEEGPRPIVLLGAERKIGGLRG